MRKRMTEKLQVLESGVTELTRLKKHHISIAETEVCALLSLANKMRLISVLQEFLHGKLGEAGNEGQHACPEPPCPELELDTTDEVMDGSNE
jgi:hypothetical protein